MFKKIKVKGNNDSRQAILWMHPTALVKFMTSGRWVINKGSLPDDVEYSHVYWDPNRQVWALVLKSSEFKELKMGDQLPELPPVEFRFYEPSKDGIVE